MISAFILLLAAQTTPVQPIIKGTGLPPPGTDEAAVMAPINTFLAALAARDGTAILAPLRPDGGATKAIEGPDGKSSVHRLGWAEYAASVKPGPERYLETLYNPAIEIDGDIAMVWGRYDFRIDGKIDHCGYDHFDLVRENGRWAIANITWSSRTTGCE